MIQNAGIHNFFTIFNNIVVIFIHHLFIVPIYTFTTGNWQDIIDTAHACSCIHKNFTWIVLIFPSCVKFLNSTLYTSAIATNVWKLSVK